MLLCDTKTYELLFIYSQKRPNSFTQRAEQQQPLFDHCSI